VNIGTLATPAAIVGGEWRPAIGDPTFVGWLTVAAYFAAALICGLAARREPAPDGRARPGPTPFWLALTTLMILLGINKQLDLQSLLTVTARRILTASGLYAGRRTYQVAFIGAVGATCAVLLGISAWASRRSLRHRGVAMVGMAFVLGYVAIRAASFHHVDALIGSRLGGLKWNWIFELGGILVIIAGGSGVAFRRPKPSRQGSGRR